MESRFSPRARKPADADSTRSSATDDTQEVVASSSTVNSRFSPRVRKPTDAEARRASATDDAQQVVASTSQSTISQHDKALESPRGAESKQKAASTSHAKSKPSAAGPYMEFAAKSQAMRSTVERPPSPGPPSPRAAAASAPGGTRRDSVGELPPSAQPVLHLPSPASPASPARVRLRMDCTLLNYPPNPTPGEDDAPGEEEQHSAAPVAASGADLAGIAKQQQLEQQQQQQQAAPPVVQAASSSMPLQQQQQQQQQDSSVSELHRIAAAVGDTGAGTPAVADETPATGGAAEDCELRLRSHSRKNVRAAVTLPPPTAADETADCSDSQPGSRGSPQADTQSHTTTKRLQIRFAEPSPEDQAAALQQVQATASPDVAAEAETVGEEQLQLPLAALGNRVVQRSGPSASSMRRSGAKSKSGRRVQLAFAMDDAGTSGESGPPSPMSQAPPQPRQLDTPPQEQQQQQEPEGDMPTAWFRGGPRGEADLETGPDFECPPGGEAGSAPRVAEYVRVTHVASLSRHGVDARLEPLQEDARLFVGSWGRRHRVIGLPEVLADGTARFLPSDVRDSASNKPGYIRAVLGEAVQLLVLLPSLMVAPQWLRDSFSMLTDTEVYVDWDIDWRDRVVLTLHQQLEQFTGQTLNVWQSKRTVQRGQMLALGGAEAGAAVTDLNYVLVVKPVASIMRKRGQQRRRKSVYYQAVDDALGTSDFSTLSSLLLGVDGSESGAKQHMEPEQMLLIALDRADLDLVALLVERGIAFGCSDHVARRLLALAMASQDWKLLCLIVQRTATEIKYNMLEAIIANWAPLINASFDLESLLLNYVLTRRCPLSSISAVLRAMAAQMENDNSKQMLKPSYNRFHELLMQLINKVQELQSNAANEHSASLQMTNTIGVAPVRRGASRTQLTREAPLQTLPTMEELLEPLPEGETTINDFSPLRVAFEVHDSKFICHPIMVAYTQVRWEGQEYSQLTGLSADVDELSAASPQLGYKLLRNLGMAGTMGDPLIRAGSTLWHAAVFESRAFFSSGRGHWCLRVYGEILFLTLFHYITFSGAVVGHLPIFVHVALGFFIVNYLADMSRDMSRYIGARFGLYLSRQWNGIHMTFLGSVSTWLAVELVVYWHTQTEEANDDMDADEIAQLALLNDVQRVLLSLVCIIVWIRALSLVVPISKYLGALVNLAGKMATEIIAFATPTVMVMVGFITAISSIFSLQMSGYTTFWEGSFTLLSVFLGNNFSPVDIPSGPGFIIPIVGSLLFTAFLIIFPILLMNLCVAILGQLYRPEQVQAESYFHQSEMIDRYTYEVRRLWVGAPFTSLQWLLFWLPRTQRQRVTGRACGRLLLPPLDGTRLEDAKGFGSSLYMAGMMTTMRCKNGLLPRAEARRRTTDGTRRRTADGTRAAAAAAVAAAAADGDDCGDEQIGAGFAEIPHTVFLLTIAPVFAALTLALFLLHAPFAIAHFGMRGHRKLAPAWFNAGYSALFHTNHRSRGTSALPSGNKVAPAPLTLPVAAPQRKRGALEMALRRALKLPADALIFCVAATFGSVLYLGLLGGVGLVGWSFSYVAPAKLLWSLLNLFGPAFMVPLGWVLHVIGCLPSSSSDEDEANRELSALSENSCNGVVQVSRGSKDRNSFSMLKNKMVSMLMLPGITETDEVKQRPSNKIMSDDEMLRAIKKSGFRDPYCQGQLRGKVVQQDAGTDTSGGSSTSSGGDSDDEHDPTATLRHTVRSIQNQNKAVLDWQKHLERRLTAGGLGLGSASARHSDATSIVSATSGQLTSPFGSFSSRLPPAGGQVNRWPRQSNGNHEEP